MDILDDEGSPLSQLLGAATMGSVDKADESGLLGDNYGAFRIGVPWQIVLSICSNLFSPLLLV